ncbi:hypothetical protein P0D72_37360 [Paraburkholderia sediminicola]|uniref:hypothetical protein n=1 Tax=Paraburkholderia sediminicola TaxID=458836 RepID=UPI0038BB5E5D
MMTSFMVMGSVLWMEGGGLGLARNIVQRYALETGSDQGFGIDEKSPITVLTGRTMSHSISPGGPGKLDLEDTYALACTFKILYGIVMQELGYCQGLELS